MLQKYIRKTAALKDDKMMPVIKRCLIDIVETTDTFDSKKDGIAIVQMYKSGYLPPTDIQNTSFLECIHSIRIENRGIYHVTLPETRYIGKMAKELEHLQPYQQWRVCNRKLAYYNKIRTKNNYTLDGINRMVIALKGNRAEIKSLKKQKKDVQETLRLIAKKEPIYYNIKCDLEEMYGTFSIDIKQPKSPDLTLKPDPIIEPAYVGLATDDDSNKDDLSRSSSSDLTPMDSISTKNMADGEPFLRWISTKGKCKALYPFEITANGEICISNQNEFWVAEKENGAGWNTAQKVVVEDNKNENVIPLLCLEKCTILEHRFLVLDQPVQ